MSNAVIEFPHGRSQRDIITRRQWEELSRLLMERAHSGFSADELATVHGFINYVAPDVENLQTRKDTGKC